MARATERTLKVAIPVFLITVFLLEWSLLDSMEADLSQVAVTNVAQEREYLLPLLQARMSPESLAHETLLDTVRDIAELLPETAGTIRKRALETFGSDVQFMLKDREGGCLDKEGLDATETRCLSLILDWSSFLIPRSDLNWDRFSVALESLFGKSFPFAFGVSTISIVQAQFRKTHYMVLIGTLFPGSPVSAPVSYLTRDKSFPVQKIPLVRGGAFAILVPLAFFQRGDWFMESLSKNKTQLSFNSWVGTRKKPALPPGFPGSLGEAFKRALDQETSGEIFTEEGGAAFSGLPGDPDRVISLWDPSPPIFRLARSPMAVAIGFLSLFLSVSGILKLLSPPTSCPEPPEGRTKGAPSVKAGPPEEAASSGSLPVSPAPGFVSPGVAPPGRIPPGDSPGEGKPIEMLPAPKSSIGVKFLLLSLLTCIAPTLGLGWTSVSGMLWDSDVSVMEEFRSLEADLQNLENVREKSLSDRVSLLKQVLSDPVWVKGLPPASFTDKIIPELASGDVNRLFLIPPSQPVVPIRVITTKENEKQVEKTDRFFSRFLAKLGRSLRFRKDSDRPVKSGHGEEATDDLVFETIEQSFDPMQLLKTWLSQDRINSWQILHENTWTFFHTFFSKDFQIPLAVMANFARRQAEFSEMRKALLESPFLANGQPSLVFMNSYFTNNPNVFPIWAESHPGIRSLLKRLTMKGGKIRGKLTVGGRPHIFLGRALKDWGFVAFSVRPDPRGTRKPWGALLSNAVVLYPVGIIVLMAFIFSRFFLRPVRSLQEGVGNLLEGGETTRLPALTEDEIGDLCNSFNSMADGLREKEFLSRFLSDLTMDAIARGGEPKATKVDATILTADIRGFTSMSEEKAPEEIVGMLNAYLTRMEPVIEGEGGTIDKFIGDAILAVFLPVHGRPPAPERAAQAGWNMLSEVAKFNEEREGRGEFPIRIGVGIGSGRTILGVLGGGSQRQDFTVTGPTVNLSAEMEKATKSAPGPGIVVCPLTEKSLSPRWKRKPLVGGKIRVPAFVILERFRD